MRRISPALLSLLAATEISTLSLHDALPISITNWCLGILDAKAADYCRSCPRSHRALASSLARRVRHVRAQIPRRPGGGILPRSEEHTSELQSLRHLVCRLLLAKNTERFDTD